MNTTRQVIVGWALMALARAASAEPVVLEVWTAPQYDWDSQTGEKDGPNVALFQTLKEVALGFGDALEFRPNMYINDGNSVCSVDQDGNPLDSTAKEEVCIANCANGRRYCEVPPIDPVHYQVTGKMILAESLRRMCIWQVYGDDGNWDEESKFFDYLQTFHEAKCPASNFAEVCISGVFDAHNLNATKIRNCVKGSEGLAESGENTVFQRQVDAQAETKIDALVSLPAVLISGEVQAEVTADALFAIICKQIPNDKLPDDICDGHLEETLGDDEDKEEEKAAEEILEEEIAEDLGDSTGAGENQSEGSGDETEKEGQDTGDESKEQEEPKPEEEKEVEEDLKDDGDGLDEQLEGEEGSKEENKDEEGPTDITEESLEKEEEKLENLEAVDAGTVATSQENSEDAIVVELWTTPDLDWDPETGHGKGPNVELFDHLKEVVVGFGDNIVFRPQMYISSQDDICIVDDNGNDLTEGAKNECGDTNCSNKHRYCAVAPDDWKVTGSSLVEESLRRMCLWEVYGRNDDGQDDVLYFDYLAKFHDLKCDNTSYKESCISSVFSSVGIDSAAVDDCIKSSGGLTDDVDNEILKQVMTFQKATFTFHKFNFGQMPLLLVNGSPVEGADEQSLEQLFAVVCEKFTTDKQPDVCQGDLTETLGEDEGDPEAHASDIPEASESEAPQATEAPEESQKPEETTVPQPDITPETSSPKGSWDLSSAGAGDGDGTSTTEESAEKGSEAGPEEGIASPNAPDTAAPTKLALPTPTIPTIPSDGNGEDESLYSLDLKLVDTAIEHLAVLQKCDVDTAALVSNVMALGGTDGHFKDAAATIESDIPMLMSQDCPHEEGEEILARMEDFHKCAMFDLQELIETFPSAATGVMLRCANAYSNMTKEEEDKGFVPEACIRTLEADSVLGRGLFGLYLYPDVACPCFEKLHDSIPECTADVWPIPINGALVKVQGCLVGQYCQAIDGLCEDNLKTLHECLPPKGTKPEDMVCSDIFTKCDSVYENVPPMLSAAPLPDACMRVAEGSTFYGQHVVERYDVFRHQCGENIELWEGHSRVAEFKNFVTHGIMGIDYRSWPFVFGALGGFFAGIIFAIVVIIVRKFCLCVQACFRSCCERCCGRKKKRNERPKAKDYATVDTGGDDVSEYRD